MANCTFTTGSATHTMKAKRILEKYSIPVNTTKVSSVRDRKGCMHGIIFPCSQKSNVARILSANGVPYEEYSE